MPRTARLNLPGGAFHVVSRFARDEWWLDREGARDAYLKLLGTAAQVDDAQVLAYCLMSSHVHLVVIQGTLPLSRMMRSVNTGFAAWAHRSRRRGKAQGQVFADRPRMVLVERDDYLLELVRYVHNNPVRAGVARHARGSTWSSHRAYVGAVPAPDWLQLSHVLRSFGHGVRAQRKFDAFVDEGRKEPRRAELSGAQDVTEAAAVRRALGDAHRMSDGVLGSDAFVQRVRSDADRVGAPLSSRGRQQHEGALGRPALRAVIDAVLELLELDALDMQHSKSRRSTHAKRLITWLWVHEYGGRQTEVARALQLRTGAVSRHYAQALALAGEFDEQASAVVAWLKKHKRSGARGKTKATQGGLGVRYHVDVEET